MKKQISLLMAGGIMIFASCTQPADTGMSDAQVDSMVNVRVEEIRAEMMAQNDSLINVMAMMKADSMIAAMKGTKPAARKAAPKNSGTTSPGQDAPATTQPETNTRPGATNQGEKKATDRPGSTNQGEKKATDRPGARNR